MELLVTVIVLLAVVAAGVFLIHRLNSQHGARIASFHYGRYGAVVPDRKPTAGQPSGRRDHRAGGRGRLRPRRRTHQKPV
ncbi:hypothetical protein AB0G32_05275 [Streptomyces sp. NPDC023723]|uniref:hypothetical protein n=1 Tax=Streptomyces sp. NPDC023723 TaxID=3154323 RepID=UPI0033F522A4